MELLWFLVVGVLSGWIAGQLLRGRGFGLVGDLIVGVIGAFIGGLVFRMLGIAAVGFLASIVSATAGAVAFVGIVRTLRQV